MNINVIINICINSKTFALYGKIEYNISMDFNSIKETENKYGIRICKRQNICFERGEGSKLFDTNNKEYLDFVGGSGESCLGYSYPALTEAISCQSKKLINCPDIYFSEPRAILNKNLVDNTIFSKSFICSGHSDAFFSLVYFIRMYCRLSKDTRKTIIAVTDNKIFNINNRVENTQNGIYNDLKIKAISYGDFNELKEAFNDDVCAVIISPIMSEGVTIMDNNYVLKFYALAKSSSALIAIDETNIGYARTGELFAFEHYGINPDIVAISKGLGGGLIMGAVLMRRDIAVVQTDKKQLFQASALECQAANVVVSTIRSGMLDDIKRKGEYLATKLSKLRKYNFVTDIRGKGLIWGIELSPKLKAERVEILLQKRGFLVSVTANNTIKLTPPFTVSEQEIDMMTDELARLFSETNI